MFLLNQGKVTNLPILTPNSLKPFFQVFKNITALFITLLLTPCNQKMVYNIIPNERFYFLKKYDFNEF